jgi:hypothetical protein
MAVQPPPVVDSVKRIVGHPRGAEATLKAVDVDLTAHA